MCHHAVMISCRTKDFVTKGPLKPHKNPLVHSSYPWLLTHFANGRHVGVQESAVRAWPVHDGIVRLHHVPASVTVVVIVDCRRATGLRGGGCSGHPSTPLGFPMVAFPHTSAGWRGLGGTGRTSRWPSTISKHLMRCDLMKLPMTAKDGVR